LGSDPFFCSFDCDGHLDLFGSSLGDYDNPTFGAPYRPGSSSSRPLFGHGNGRFTDPYLTWGLTASVFGCKRGKGVRPLSLGFPFS
jgi:hypothetical protein